MKKSTKVGSGPKVENQMIFALSVHPRTVE